MVEFDAEQVLYVKPFLSVTAGIVVLFVGKAINERVAALGIQNAAAIRIYRAVASSAASVCRAMRSRVARMSSPRIWRRA